MRFHAFFRAFFAPLFFHAPLTNFMYPERGFLGLSALALALVAFFLVAFLGEPAILLIVTCFRFMSWKFALIDPVVTASTAEKQAAFTSKAIFDAARIL